MDMPSAIEKTHTPSFRQEGNVEPGSLKIDRKNKMFTKRIVMRRDLCI